jgi:hypothetical protein
MADFITADFKEASGVAEDAVPPTTSIRTARAKPHNHDNSVTFYEYKYYAELTRAEQDSGNVPTTGSGEHGMLPTTMGTPARAERASDHEGSQAAIPASNPHIISDDEWMTASRAIRTATWLSVFYLITTDILGPYGVPFAIGTLGWGPGMALYAVFGILAAL